MAQKALTKERCSDSERLQMPWKAPQEGEELQSVEVWDHMLALLILLFYETKMRRIRDVSAVLASVC